MRAVKSTPTRLTLPLHPSQRSFPGIAGSQWSASPSGRRSAAKEVWQTWWTRWNRRNSWSWPRQSKTVGTSSMESHNSLEAATFEPCENLYYLTISKKHRLVLFCWKCSFGFISRAWREYVLLDHMNLKYGNREMIKRISLNSITADIHCWATRKAEQPDQYLYYHLMLSCLYESIYPQHTNILSVQFLALGWRILSHLLTLIYVYVTSTVLVLKDLIWFVTQLTTATVTVVVSLTTFHDVDEKKWWYSWDLRWHIADF